MPDPPWLALVHHAATPTDSFWLERSILTEGVQEATPFLLPPEPGAPTTAQLVDEVVEAEKAALDHRLEPILARWPDQIDAIRDAWDAAWDRFRLNRRRDAP